MDLKSDIKNRRKERIRSLLEEIPNIETAEVPPLFVMPEKSTSFKEWGTGFKKNEEQSSIEPDPEVMWKERRGAGRNKEEEVLNFLPVLFDGL